MENDGAEVVTLPQHRGKLPGIVQDACTWVTEHSSFSFSAETFKRLTIELPLIRTPSSLACGASAGEEGTMMSASHAYVGAPSKGKDGHPGVPP